MTDMKEHPILDALSDTLGDIAEKMLHSVKAAEQNASSPDLAQAYRQTIAALNKIIEDTAQNQKMRSIRREKKKRTIEAFRAMSELPVANEFMKTWENQTWWKLMLSEAPIDAPKHSARSGTVSENSNDTKDI